jgi:hypothetical protein
VNLLPQDVVVVLKLLTSGDQPWTYARLGAALQMSPSQVLASVIRSQAARLLAASTQPRRGQRGRAMLPETNRGNLKEFLVHGVRYAFPAERGGATRGVPTAESAPPLDKYFPQSAPLASVWPHPRGRVRGLAFSPLYRSAPLFALDGSKARDAKLYEALALVDAIRDGRARERELAVAELESRIDSA